MKYLFSIVIIALSVSSAFSESHRVFQIPNGSTFQCANCHVNPLGSGPRNAFGQTVEANFLINGNVTWNAELAALDSDGDGFTNGQELFDPNGIWRTGDPNPEVVGEVGNPGNASSLPVSVLENYKNKESGMIKMDFLSANPTSAHSKFEVNFKKAGSASIEIFSVSGNKVKTIFEGHISEGTSAFQWDGSNNEGESTPGGMYLLVIRLGDAVLIEKVLALK